MIAPDGIKRTQDAALARLTPEQRDALAAKAHEAAAVTADAVSDELEELDVCEQLFGLDTRMVAIGLALRGSGTKGETLSALSRLVDDVRGKLDELNQALQTQDATKRARGEPRVERIFPCGPGEEAGRS
jgi:hypothetical protein